MSQSLSRTIAVIGIDIGKNSFHVVGLDERGAIVLRQKWSRGQVEARLPFLLGLVVGVVGFILRRQVTEASPVERSERSSIVETLRDHWQLVARLAALSVFNAVSFYAMFVYVASWLQTADGISPAHALEINTTSMLVLLPTLLVSGWLSDRFGRKTILMLSTVIAVIVALPLFWVMYHPSPALILLGQMGFGLIIGLYSGTQATTMVESTPPQIRCTAVALGYNACVGVIGGLTPLVAAWLVARTADELAPAYLIMVAAAVSFFAAWGIKETYRCRSPDGYHQSHSITFEI